MYEEKSLVGKILNERYEILEVVGSGGMATVYKAECKLLNRFVAVKVLKDSLRYDLDLKEKFNREAQAAAKLSHNNIVSIFDVGEIDGLNYIVMEYVDGITLTEYINANKPIHWKVARNISIQIGMALEHAHANGIIHRDIKPHNILVTKDNVIKVADFGIASVVTSETVDTSRTDGAAIGSVYYISPEQARGGYVTETTDIYSLGVIMYEMVTGQLPFDGDNAVSIAMKKIEQEPVNCKVINLDVPQDMAEIVMRAISKDPAARFQTSQELLIALKKLGTGSQGTNIPSTRTSEERQEEIKKRKEKSEKASNNRMIINIIISMLIVIALVASGIYVILNWGAKEVKVPELLDKTLEEAILSAEENGLRIDEKNIKYELSEDVEEGRIISQKPGANTYTKKNKKITLVISQGATEGDITMVSVLGMQYEKAVETLEKMGLKTKKLDREDKDAELNEVVAQSPKKGVKVSEDTVIELYVCTSKPEEHVEVPKVVGLTKAQADAILTSSKLRIGNVKKEYSDKPEGEILSQNPSEGSESPSGTYVDIVLSAGKEPVEEPPQNEDPPVVQVPNEDPGYNENPSHTTTPEPVNPEPVNPQPTTPEPTTPEPTTPEPVNPNPPNNVVKPQKKTITIPLPATGDDVIQVRVLANGKEFYNQQHQRSEGKVDITVESTKDANIQVYFGQNLVVEKVVEFN